MPQLLSLRCFWSSESKRRVVTHRKKSAGICQQQTMPSAEGVNDVFSKFVADTFPQTQLKLDYWTGKGKKQPCQRLDMLLGQFVENEQNITKRLTLKYYLWNVNSRRLKKPVLKYQSIQNTFTKSCSDFHQTMMVKEHVRQTQFIKNAYCIQKNGQTNSFLYNTFMSWWLITNRSKSISKPLCGLQQISTTPKKGWVKTWLHLWKDTCTPRHLDSVSLKVDSYFWKQHVTWVPIMFSTHSLNF